MEGDNSETEYHQQPLLSPPLPYRKKINTDKVLSIIAQSQHIILSKNLSQSEREMLISNSAMLLRFVKKDNYPKPLFKGLFGKEKPS